MHASLSCDLINTFVRAISKSCMNGVTVVCAGRHVRTMAFKELMTGWMTHQLSTIVSFDIQGNLLIVQGDLLWCSFIPLYNLIIKYGIA